MDTRYKSFLAYLKQETSVPSPAENRPFDNRLIVIKAMANDDKESFNNMWKEDQGRIIALEKKTKIKFPLQKKSITEFLVALEITAISIKDPLQKALKNVRDMQEKEEVIIDTYIRAYLFHLFTDIHRKKQKDLFDNFYRIVRNVILTNSQKVILANSQNVILKHSQQNTYDKFLKNAEQTIIEKAAFNLNSPYLKQLKNLIGQESFEKIFLQALQKMIAANNNLNYLNSNLTQLILTINESSKFHKNITYTLINPPILSEEEKANYIAQLSNVIKNHETESAKVIKKGISQQHLKKEKKILSDKSTKKSPFITKTYFASEQGFFKPKKAIIAPKATGKIKKTEKVELEKNKRSSSLRSLAITRKSDKINPINFIP